MTKFRFGKNNTIKEEERSHVLGHLRVWRHIIEQDLDYALIVEEDVSGLLNTEDFNSNWQSMMNLLNQDTEVNVVQLQTSASAEQASTPTVTDGMAGASGMYFVTRQGARRLAKHYKDAPMDLDDFFAKEEGFKFSPGLAIANGAVPAEEGDLELPWCENFAKVKRFADVVPKREELYAFESWAGSGQVKQKKRNQHHYYTQSS